MNYTKPLLTSLCQMFAILILVALIVDLGVLYVSGIEGVPTSKVLSSSIDIFEPAVFSIVMLLGLGQVVDYLGKTAHYAELSHMSGARPVQPSQPQPTYESQPSFEAQPQPKYYLSLGDDRVGPHGKILAHAYIEEHEFDPAILAYRTDVGEWREASLMPEIWELEEI